MVWEQISHWWPYIVTGLVCGIFSGIFGLGGGVLMVPALALIFGLSQKSAQGVALAVMVPTALVGAIRYKLDPTIDVNIAVAVAMALGAVVGAYIGTAFVSKIPTVVLTRLFAIVIMIIAVKMLFTKAPQKPNEQSASFTIAKTDAESS